MSYFFTNNINLKLIEPIFFKNLFEIINLQLLKHNIKKLYEVLVTKKVNQKPKVVVANTIKGKGFKLFENNNNWHHSVVTKSIYKEILQEL